MSLVESGLEVMALGLAGVFAVLILFYFMIKLLIKAFPPKEES
ncbi:OadG-related small transporter subunit [Candidatus Formimonas warabiya]|nr:OadG-related small transporter subunit [Candidatus Formimonas warabiya]